jgi:hypothetical protein
MCDRGFEDSPYTIRKKLRRTLRAVSSHNHHLRRAINQCLPHKCDLYSGEPNTLLALSQITQCSIGKTYAAVMEKTSIPLASVNHTRHNEISPLNPAIAASRTSRLLISTSAIIEITGVLKTITLMSQKVIFDTVLSRYPSIVIGARFFFRPCSSRLNQYMTMIQYSDSLVEKVSVRSCDRNMTRPSLAYEPGLEKLPHVVRSRAMNGRAISSLERKC